VEAMNPFSVEAVEKRWQRLLKIGVATSVLVVFLGCSGLITAFETPFHLFFGWALHARSAFPALAPRWTETLLPLACLTLALWLAHRFIRWWLAAKGSAMRWHLKHTLSASALLLLGSAAAIAMSGIVHQAVWLMDEPWYERRGMDAVRTMTINSARQVLLAIEDFRIEEGRYPDSLIELPLPSSLITAVPRSDGAAEPFVYFKPKPEDLSDDEVLLLVSPVLRSDGRFIAAFSNGRINVMPGGEFSILLETRRMPQREKP
jgi:hypothetical protein